ncbi:hypothetical protein EYC84_007691 [Monilinia fructicola]|uniref:Uncharacterized protein n=1 Tax=Monilinia fructicola TaxID=38448 RepID=A0A5M9JJ65_MONFR|nr:hypothetical protein EYC84_007691 [Monilinia fructicola]
MDSTCDLRFLDFPPSSIVRAYVFLFSLPYIIDFVPVDWCTFFYGATCAVLCRGRLTTGGRLNIRLRVQQEHLSGSDIFLCIDAPFSNFSSTQHATSQWIRPGMISHPDFSNLESPPCTALSTFHFPQQSLPFPNSIPSIPTRHNSEWRLRIILAAWW